jgi:hypothetical protein
MKENQPRQILAINNQTMTYIGQALMLVLFLLIPAHSFASTGTGGSLPYEPWLTSLTNSVTGHVFSRSVFCVVKMQAFRNRVESLRNYVAYPLLGRDAHKSFRKNSDSSLVCVTSFELWTTTDMRCR